MVLVSETATFSPGACLREAASAKAGERERVRGRKLFLWFVGDEPVMSD